VNDTGGKLSKVQVQISQGAKEPEGESTMGQMIKEQECHHSNATEI